MNSIILKVVSPRLMRVNSYMQINDDTVEELYEYKNLGVLKNYCSSFASNISDNIDKTRKKAGIIFSSNVDRLKTNPLIHVKFWRQAFLPSLLFGPELLTLTPVCCLSLNAVSPGFLKNVFMCQILPPVHPYLCLSRLKPT